MTTPTTPEGLRQYDDLPALEAIIAAWTVPGPHPEWHAEMQQRAREAMPQVTQRLDAGRPHAAAAAWADLTCMPTGRQQDSLRAAMPVLVRALERAVEGRREAEIPPPIGEAMHDASPGETVDIRLNEE